MERYTIQAREKGATRWTTMETGLTAEEAADWLEDNMHDDATWNESYIYKITTE